MTRRRRKTAAEIAGRSQKGGLFTIGMIAIGLVVVIYLKVTLGDSDSEFLNQLTGDPDLVLPKSVLDALDAGRVDGGVDVGGAADMSIPPNSAQ